MVPGASRPRPRLLPEGLQPAGLALRSRLEPHTGAWPRQADGPLRGMGGRMRKGPRAGGSSALPSRL